VWVQGERLSGTVYLASPIADILYIYILLAQIGLDPCCSEAEEGCGLFSKAHGPNLVRRSGGADAPALRSSASSIASLSLGLRRRTQ
jgi:hypothetical protein